jgi:DNA-binding NarL/FixJ family response regulator
MTCRDGQAGALRVLLVDDHELMRRGLALLLKSEEDLVVVGEAAEAPVGVELARSLRPDVILMDVSMPGASGMQATRQIRQEMPHTVIIGLSMHDMDGVRESMMAAGADEYFTKDTPPEQLLAAIRRLGRRP